MTRLNGFVNAMWDGRLRIVLNRHTILEALVPPYATRDGEDVREVLARDLSSLVATMCRIKDAPYSETTGEEVASNCKRVGFDELPGWAITVFKETERGVPTGKVGTVSAHYQDGPASFTRFIVPVAMIWGEAKEVEVRQFVRYTFDECGWCGCNLTGANTYECPQCGGN